MTALRLAWSELACRVPAGADRFGMHREGAPGFWRELLERLSLHLGLERPSRFAAHELYERFTRADAWELFPEVPSVLAGLRERGFAIAVLSNWDERLPRVLAALGLDIDPVLTSQGCGCAKPSRAMFHQAVRALGVEPAHLLHVGDSQIEDFEGAIAAGCRAVLLDRAGEHSDLRTLSGLLDRLFLARPIAASLRSTRLAEPRPIETETP